MIKTRLEERGELFPKTSLYFTITITIFPKRPQVILRPTTNWWPVIAEHSWRQTIHTRESFVKVVFGFTNCPDICPAEHDRVTTRTTVLNSIRMRFPLPSRLYRNVKQRRSTYFHLSSFLCSAHCVSINTWRTSEAFGQNISAEVVETQINEWVSGRRKLGGNSRRILS